MRNMVNKNIKRMLLFVTLCILLIGIVSAEDNESDDSTIQTDTISDQITDSVNTVSEVNDNVVNDNTEDLKKDVKTEKTIKTATTKTKTKVSIDPVSDVSIDDWVLVMGTLTDINNNPIANAPLRIDVNGDDYNTETNDYGDFFGEYIPDSTGLKTITVSYTGNSKYEATSAKSTFTVKGQTSTYITLNEIKDTTVGNTVKVSGHYYYGYEKPLTYTTMRININGQAYTAKTDNNGYFTYNYKTTKTGTNTVTVSYPGNTNFKSAKETATFNVNPVGPQYTYITLNNINEVTLGQTTTISGYYYYGSNIPLTYTTMRLNINGKTYTAKTDSKGYFTYNYKTTKDGSNTVTVSYPGNTNFKSATATKTFNVKSVGPQYTYITLNNIQEVAYGGYTTISGYYYYGNNIPLILTTMRLNINGKQVTSKTDNKGYFTYSYKTERVGKNTVTVSYPGNDNFKSATATKTFNVKITSPIYTYITLNSIKEVTNGQTTTISGHYYYGNNIPLIQTTMRLNINGKTYSAKTDDNGYFIYNYKTTKDGSNTVTVSYPGNTNFKSATSSKTFNVKSAGPQYTYIKLYDISDARYDGYAYISGYYYYGNDVPLTSTPMTINVNGEKYTTKTDNTGYFSYYYEVLEIGKKTVTVSYHGNTYFKAASATKTFNVYISSPIDTDIYLYEINDVKAGEYTTISGYYTYGYGTPLTQTTMRININGQTYTTKTDNNGYFKYNYKATKGGTNYVTVSYPGNNNFEGDSYSTSFYVQSAKKSTILTLNVPDGGIEGDYSIIWGEYTDENGNPLKSTTITITFNGKKYYSQTGKDGSYYLHCDGTKSGTNTVTASYPGNDNYYGDSVTKTFTAQPSGIIEGDIIMVGSKNFVHYGCGGHVIYSGYDGHCNKCGADFYGNYVI
jgi:hypothetical protein